MWDEFAVDELRMLLAEHRGAAEDLMSRSHDLAVKLPGTMALFEAGTYEPGGRTCLCNAGPKCRHDHRLKQQPRWKVDQLSDGTFRWTTPSGRSYTTEPTLYPI